MKICLKNAASFVDAAKLKQLESQTEAANLLLENGKGAGNDYIGWVHLPSSITDEFIAEVQSCADELRRRCEVVIVAGIGGSYLGARAVNEALASAFDAFVAKDRKNPYVVYAGNNIGEDYLAELMEFLADKQFGIINISKSGTTTETALAFRLLKTMLEKQVGKEEARHRIVAVTDRAKGALRSLSTKEGYKTFVIPDDVGGRFSVLTPVGLLPIAVAGGNIKELVRGAQEMEKATDVKVPFAQNPACQYAAIRNALYQSGKKIEILVNFNPKLHYFSEWWKQLYGESEGKDHKGIFPASVDFTTDLHSMGQWIQDGERTIFETVISIEKANKTVLVPTDEENLDGLNFLAGKRVDEVNKMAELGTQLAHVDGGVPNIHIEFEKIDEFNIGQFIYFFERGCGISGYVLDVNPFNQPGVEAYKKNMFALLDKPGYEADSKAIKARLGKAVVAILMLMLSVTAFGSSKQPVAFTTLPETVQQVVLTNFSLDQIQIVTSEKAFGGFKYMFLMADGTKVEYNSKAQLLEAENLQGINDAFVPEAILTYIRTTFPNATITEYKNEGNKQEIELNDKMELVFSKNGKFLRIED